MSGHRGSPHGFAAMDPATQRAIASKGGTTAQHKGTGHQWTPEEAREAGRKGGSARARRRREAAIEAAGPAPVEPAA